MPALKVRIPRSDLDLYSDGTVSAAVKTRLAKLLASIEHLPAPIALPAGLAGDSVTIWVSADQEAQLAELASRHALAGTGGAAAAVLHGWALAQRPVDVDSQTSPAPPPPRSISLLDELNQALGDATRPDQARFYDGIIKELRRDDVPHRVLFAEASTGVGKTRAFLAACLDWLGRHPGEVAVVAAPSYNILLQSVAQWQRLEAVKDLPPWQVIAGQGEFVSAHALEAILAENPDLPGAEAAAAWMKAGGPAPNDDPIGHRWLLRSLAVATENRWRHEAEIRLHSDVDDDDPGLRAYRQQFTTDDWAPSLIFCTHAMLAVEIRRRIHAASKRHEEQRGNKVQDAAWTAWNRLAEDDRRTSMTWELRNELLATLSKADDGRLPAIGLVVVDEAHLLEQAVAGVFATGLSMARLRLSLRRLHEANPKLVTKSDLASIGELWDRMRGIGQLSDSLASGDTSNHPGLQDAMVRLRQLLANVLKRPAGKVAERAEVRHLRAANLALEVAARAHGERYGMRSRVSWSPAVQWPTIDIGRYDVSRELDFMWTVVAEHASVLVSATLYEDVSTAGLENMRRVLSVRTGLARPLIPIRPEWLYQPVTLHLVGETMHADGMPRFRRPAQRDKLDPLEEAERWERWRSDVSGYIALAYRSAAGGVLVLMTSHAEREQIIDRLQEAIAPDCLLTQGDGTTLESLRIQFLETTAAGRRPCLVAVGAAWTGLDLSGDGLRALTGQACPAHDDNVLTDLLIPTAPIGVNRSLTHEWRRERSGMVAEIGATAMMMRQGVGRLVRREGVPENRRLHFLDARIHESAWNPLLGPVVKALNRYARRIVV